ncbi:phosphoribosyltransferase [Ascidiaceihabitans sp.]|uniref:phosphoribosyltransferase n=1 Tax=Ascidiaceihabitans sp. TaxID=1872644 RepID=UPI0032985973
MLTTSGIMLFASVLFGVVLTVVYVKRQLAFSEFADKNSADIGIFGTSNLPDVPREDFSREAIDRLHKYAAKTSPSFILGVHTGGRLLSVLICERLGYAPDRCFFVSTDMSPDREPYILAGSADAKLGSRVLVVDDVARTGSTLEMIRRKFVRDTMSGVSKVRAMSFATLIVAAKKDRKPPTGYFVPDWWGFFTEDQDQSLPWSTLSESVRAAFLSKHKGHVDYDQEMIETHHLLITNYYFALFCANMALANNSRFEGLVKEGRLRSEWTKNQPTVISIAS